MDHADRAVRQPAGDRVGQHDPHVALPRVARPAAEGGLGASQSQLQWIVDSYTIVFAGLLLTTGTIGDRFGRYRF